MPVAFIYGWEPCLPFCASSPVPPDVSEYDVMGALRGAPVELVDCETVPLQVPASARDRDRGLDFARSRDLRDGRPVRRIHRLFRRRAGPQAPGARHLHHPPRQPDLPRHAGRHLAEDAQRELHHELGAARRARLEYPRALRRSGRHRRALPAGQQRHHADDPAQADLSRPGQAGRRGDLGLERGAPALQAHLGGRRRHRHPRLRRDRLGVRLSRQCGRGRHRVLPRHLRLGARSVDAAQVPRHQSLRHRQMVPGADRRHRQSRFRAGGELRRRPLSADGQAREGRLGAGRAPLARVRVQPNDSFE